MKNTITSQATKSEAAAAIGKLRGFIGPHQLACVDYALWGEEKQWFRNKLVELAATAASIPVTYEGDGIARLHYFTAGGDWWIIEKDAGSADDDAESFQSQCFGIADVGYGPELGYISLPELLQNRAELDFHWQLKHRDEIMGAKGGAA